MKSTALITGGDSGIGLALAHEFARQGHDLILVARDKGALDRTAADVRSRHGVEVVTLSHDLQEEDAPQILKDEIEAHGIEVDILINNAGHGQRGLFHEVPVQRHLELVRLNIDAVVRLTNLFLPEFIARNHGYLLNVASIASFNPAPLMATYHATKAFVLSLTLGIREELRDTDIKVTALAPGPTDTNFFEVADAEDTVVRQKGHVMQPEEVAEGAYKALMKGDDIYVPGGLNKAMVFMRRVLPKNVQALMNEQLYKTAK